MIAASSVFLPSNREEMRVRGWGQVDMVLVTGDAYVDHPSFGIALIARWLEAHGYRVGILAQPRHEDPSAFLAMGRPRLVYGISAGNLDSIVSNYTGNVRVRDTDVYSPEGNPYFGRERSRAGRRRPDRATIRYAQLARAAYPDVPIVLGGLEGSLRHFVHYDYQQARLRASVLTDAKADLLVYGMGERAVLEVANCLEKGQGLSGIPGTCERLTEAERSRRCFAQPPDLLPSWEEIQEDRSRFLEAELTVDRHARALSQVPLLQRQQTHWVLQNRPAVPLTSAEHDALYALPFARAPHPSAADVPAYRMIQHSVTIVRGCFGNCSFCAIARHQGPVVTSRSRESVLEEVRGLAAMPNFTGTVTDLGGPTANLYGISCNRERPCHRRDCLYPGVCRHLQLGEDTFLDLLERAEGVSGVRHVFVSSGLRMELLLRTHGLLDRLLARHLPGAMKIAPEHTEAEVLNLMHKPGPDILYEFLSTCREAGRRIPEASTSTRTLSLPTQGAPWLTWRPCCVRSEV